MKDCQIKCPKCFESRFWKTGDNRVKCKSCRYIFTPKPNPLNLSDKVLNEVVSEFLLEHSTNVILERINLSKYKLLKVLNLLRMLMSKDLPEIFRKMVKLDETYLEDLSKPLKQPIIGVLCLRGKIFAKILPNIEAEDLKFLLKKRNNRKEVIFPKNWEKHFALIFKSRIYKLTPHINALEGFWGYLKRKLAAKGGIRREKLPLYLGEYVWRYNYRKMTLKEKEKRLINLIYQYFVSKN